MKDLKRIVLILSLATFPMIALTGCEEKGPMERAGENVDDSVEKAGEKIEEAGDEIKDATNP